MWDIEKQVNPTVLKLTLTCDIFATTLQRKAIEPATSWDYTESKKCTLSRNIILGNSKSLWKAVNIAKDVNMESLPPKMFLNNILVEQSNLPDTFADFFKKKVNKIVESVNVDETVYNDKNSKH